MLSETVYQIMIVIAFVVEIEWLSGLLIILVRGEKRKGNEKG